MERLLPRKPCAGGWETRRLGTNRRPLPPSPVAARVRLHRANLKVSFGEIRTAGLGPFETLDLAQSSRSQAQVGARASHTRGSNSGNRNLRRFDGALREGRMAPAVQQRMAPGVLADKVHWGSAETLPVAGKFGVGGPRISETGSDGLGPQGHCC
jgi:hypothetical protein